MAGYLPRQRVMQAELLLARSRRAAGHTAALFLSWLLASVGPAFATGDAQTPTVGAWADLQQQYYGGRDIGLLDKTFMSLEVPANTPDPAATPMTLRFGAAAIGRVRQLRVIIDNNPSPLAATFNFAEGARVAELGLRVRIDRFTSVRAIAETKDGTLEMRSSWVNASGGCSSPPSSAAGGTLGEIRFRPSPDAKSLQISIRHPNNSGFQIDARSGDAIPPHYVSHIHLTAAGRTLADVDTGISLSENPTLLIASDTPLPAPVTVDIIDSESARFSADWPVGMTGVSTSSKPAGSIANP
jgi:sulfur-oxidizing protein SoxY